MSGKLASPVCMNPVSCCLMAVISRSDQLSIPNTFLVGLGAVGIQGRLIVVLLLNRLQFCCEKKCYACEMSMKIAKSFEHQAVRFGLHTEEE